jgi:predicted short-subunit dehydrogenase-like oxidoreductase (DUF2520 family)
MIKVVILGSGNVGRHLFKAFKNNSEIEITQWYSRNIKDIHPYSDFVEITDQLDKLVLADIYILAVSDDSIHDLSNQLSFSNRFVCHTSGSKSKNELNQKNRAGVFYPLQTFTKEIEVDFSKIPICLESSNSEDMITLKKISKTLGCSYYETDSNQREKLHLAAVFVNNFTNHMYTIAKDITDKSKIDFNILKPLISETVNKIYKLDPKEAQTGPAIRGDNKTINKHLASLENEKHKELYKLITDLINDLDHEKL